MVTAYQVKTLDHTHTHTHSISSCQWTSAPF